MTSKYPVKKILFIGEESTNLREILIRYVKDRYTEGYFNKNYFNFKFKGYEIIVEEQEIELNLWELSTSEKSAREKSLAYLDCNVVILCFDRYNLESLKKITKKWHDEVGKICGNIPCVLVGIRNRSDVDREKVMMNETILDIDIKIAMKSVKSREYSECDLGITKVKELMEGIIFLAKFPDEKNGKCCLQ